MIGNSTMADKPYSKSNLEKGWGQVLPLYFNVGVGIENHAQNGRSTKSFIDQGLWDSVIQKISPGDYLIVEFGHNDAKKEDPKRFAAAYGDYKTNLERFVTETRNKGGIPILCTPISRRNFDSLGMLVDTHGEYPKVVREIATRMQVPLVDLHKKSMDLLQKFGPDNSKKLFLYAEPGEYEMSPDGKKDDTHFSGSGAFRICDLAIEEIRVHVPQLVQWLKK